MTEGLVTISELAKLFEINQHTIRHYEGKGLLLPLEISGNGYRKYGLSEAYKLSFILFLKELGLSLKEIKSIIESGSKTDYTEMLIARKTKIIAEQKRLDILSRQVDEQIELSQKVTPKHYLLKETVKLTCLLTKSIEESVNLSDLLEVGLEKELLMGKVYYLIRENSYDVCIEAVSGKAFELEAGIYDLELLEVTNEVELTLELERLAQKSGLPLIAIEDSERFLASGDHLSLKVLGEKNA